MIIIKGIAASSGIAIGRAYVLEDDDVVVEKHDVPRDRIKFEVKRFKDAVKMTHADLDAAEQKVLLMLGRQHAKLIDAHRLILKDPLLTHEVPRRITEEMVNAEYALSQTLEQVNKHFEKIDDEFFRERRHDLFDVGKRLIRHLARQEKKSLADIKDPVVLIARNLYPSDTLHLRESRVMGFATDLGGKTSHTALLAQSMEIPAVVGLSDITRQVKNNDLVIVDGEQGIVIIAPGPEAVEKYQKMKRQLNQAERFLEAVKKLPSVTRDGHKLQIACNLDAREDPSATAALMPDAVGLVRTESMYMNRTAPPQEEEHTTHYLNIVKAFAPNPITLRLADIGGDKLTDLGIESHEKEDNPFMGLRGVRLLLRHPELLKVQLRGMVRAAASGPVKIMIPMVSSLGEVQGVKRLLAEACAELTREGAHIQPNVDVGIMVEIPSSAIILDAMLTEIQFVSVGTNDLIQYMLAVDRVNQHVAHLYDSFHPAVLRVLHLIVQTTHKKGKTVSVCGEMASDPKAVPLLVGLGVDTLSVTPRMLLKVKHTVRSLSFERCSQLAQSALSMGTSEDVRQLVMSSQDENS